MSTQIDIEDAIEFMTVAEFSKECGIPSWRVRRAIKLGHVEADQSVRPMKITGGEMPLTVSEWRKAIEPSTRRIKPGVMGWGNGGKTLLILDASGNVRAFKSQVSAHGARAQCLEIDAIDCRRISEAAE